MTVTPLYTILQDSKRKGGLVNIVQHFLYLHRISAVQSDWLIWQLSQLYWASLVSSPRAPPGEKRSGERSRISWAYSPKRWKTNEIARSLIIT